MTAAAASRLETLPEPMAFQSSVAWAERAPPRAAAVQRRRLLTLLGEARPGDIVRIDAPAGWGKSTLLAQFALLQRADQRTGAAWLSVEARHRSPDDVATALQEALAWTGVARACPPSSGSWRATVDHLMDSLARSARPLSLVLDNLERLQDHGLGEVLERLLQMSPPNLLVVAASDGGSPLKPGRLTARRRCITLGPEELAFELEESAILLDGVVGREHIAHAHETTEGWPLGLQRIRDRCAGRGVPMLPASELRAELSALGRVFAGDDLARLSGDVQAALEQGALLEDFDAEVLDQFLGRTDSHRLLEAARCGGGLLRPAPGERQAWRLHRLAQVFLQDRLEQRVGPAAVARLHLRAAELRSQRGEHRAALDHAARARNAPLAKAVFERAGGVAAAPRLGCAGLRALCALFPEDALQASPQLGVARAISYLGAGLPPAGRHAFELARVRFRLDGEAGRSGEIELAAQVFDLYAKAYGDGPAGREALAALEDLVDDPHRSRVELRLLVLAFLVMHYQQTGELVRATQRASEFSRALGLANIQGLDSHMPVHCGLIALARGDLDVAESRFRSVTSRVTSEGQVSAAYAAARVFLAEVMYERDQTAEASATLHAVLPHLERVECWFDVYAAAYGLAVRLAFLRGGAGEALAHCEALRELAARRASPRLLRLADALDADIACRLGRHGELPRLLGDRRSLCEDLLADQLGDGAHWREDDLLTDLVVRWSLAVGDEVTAQSLTCAHAARAWRQHRAPALARSLIMRALLEQSRGRLGPALQALREAIPASLQAGLQRTWTEAGEPLRRLVRRGMASGAWEDLPPAAADFVYAHGAGGGGKIREPLTDREYDVLGELSVGGSNKQIGRRLGMSENTVKTHLKSLFAKLQVDDRRRAVDAARALGLA
jgi:LuxR family maltose regulon positive regulatory protein